MEAKYADNSFRNGQFHVPLASETRPERGRNATDTGLATLRETHWYTGTKSVESGEWRVMSDKESGKFRSQKLD